MKPFSLRSLSVACAGVVLAASLNAAEPAIIAKARAYLGTEAVLNNVKSLRFTGTLTTVDSADPKKEIKSAVELTIVAPDFQRITATTDKPDGTGKIIETTALDSYEAWTKIQDSVSADAWRMNLLLPDQVRQLRANTWQSLNYYRGIEKVGGRIEDMGVVTADGVACQKIAFIHSPQIVFYRYFDVATGRLVLTETETGATMRESGEMIVDGIRFPKTLVTTAKFADRNRVITLNYDKVFVNETIPASTFAVPMPVPVPVTKPTLMPPRSLIPSAPPKK